MKRICQFALLICLVFAGAAITFTPVSAASKDKLIKSYQYKNYIWKNGAWKLHENVGVKQHKDVISYNKKNDPFKIKTIDYYKSGKTKSSTSKIKYTYKKNKAVKRKVYDRTTVYKNGIPASLTINHGDGYGRFFQYKFKSRYASYVLFRDLDPNAESVEDLYQTKHYYTLKMKSGLPVSIKGNGFPVSMTFYTGGAKKGLIKSAVIDDTRTWGDGSIEIDKRVYNYTYKVKKGKVTGAVRRGTFYFGYSKESPEKTSYKSEFKFTYTKKNTGKKRFCAMINDIVANLGEDDPYSRPVLYTYWY